MPWIAQMKLPQLDKKYLRIITLFIAGVGFIALVLITASLSSIKFLPGENIDIKSITENLPKNPIINFDLLLSFCLSGIVIMIPVAIFLLTFSSQARDILKRNLQGMIGFLIFLLIARFLGGRLGNTEIPVDPSSNPGSNLNLGDIPSISTDSVPIEPYTPDNLLSWQGYIFGFVLILILGIVALYIWEKNRPLHYDLGEIVIKTVEEIKSGRDWEDAVIQCYAKMSSTVSKKRHLDRKKSMTPNEFSRILIESGLPETPVNKLTTLFEKARYGKDSPRLNDADEAVECLTQITLSLENSV